MSAYKINLVALKYAFVIIIFFIKGQESTDPDIDLRIYGGEETDIKTIPFQVSIMFRPKHHDCGGSIINRYFIVTAAHCLFKTKEEMLKYLIVVGSTDLKKPYKIYNIADIILHERFNQKYPFKTFGANDIALIRVDKPIAFSEFVKPIKLARTWEWYADGTPAVASGYGACDFPNKRTYDCDTLRKVTVYIEGQQKCRENMKQVTSSRILSTQLCYKGEIVNGTYREQAGVNDSGGPLTVDDRLVGIISWGPSNLKRLEGSKINTRISKYVHWIRRNIAKSSRREARRFSCGNNDNEKSKYYVIIITLFHILYFTFQNLTY